MHASSVVLGHERGVAFRDKVGSKKMWLDTALARWENNKSRALLPYAGQKTRAQGRDNMEHVPLCLEKVGKVDGMEELLGLPVYMDIVVVHPCMFLISLRPYSQTRRSPSSRVALHGIGVLHLETFLGLSMVGPRQTRSLRILWLSDCWVGIWSDYAQELTSGHLQTGERIRTDF